MTFHISCINFQRSVHDRIINTMLTVTEEATSCNTLCAQSGLRIDCYGAIYSNVLQVPSGV